MTETSGCRSELRLAALRSAIDPFIVMDVMRQANAREAAGDHVIHMEVGQPATKAPDTAIEAARRALGSDRIGYTDALGLSALRERIARHYLDWYGLTVSPERVIVTSGSSGAFILAFLALFDPGARVALPAPGYPCYRHILKVLGITPVTLPTGEAGRWMPEAAQLDARPDDARPDDARPDDARPDDARLDGLLLASPANPTGTMLTPERLADLARACEARGIRFISDEIYHGLSHGLPQASALQSSDGAIVINSFSKYFSMTGWRVGWMVVPPELVRPVERLAQNLFICAPAISQHAALGAFDGFSQLETYRQTYAANRDYLLHELPRLGFDRICPADGAFYLYADISGRKVDSVTFARRLLEETGIAVTPGNDFDPVRGKDFVRFSYARATADMEEAVARLQRWPGLRV